MLVKSKSKSKPKQRKGRTYKQIYRSRANSGRYLNSSRQVAFSPRPLGEKEAEARKRLRERKQGWVVA